MQTNDNHIRQQLFDFDELPAADAFNVQQGWQQLEVQLHPQKKRSLVVPIAAACIVVLLLSMAWLIQQPGSTSELAKSSTPSQAISNNSNSSLTVNAATSLQKTSVVVASNMHAKPSQVVAKNMRVASAKAIIHLPQGRVQDTLQHTANTPAINTLQVPNDTTIIVATTTPEPLRKPKPKVVHLNELFPTQAAAIEITTAQAKQLAEAAALEAAPAPKSRHLLPLFQSAVKNN